MHTFSLLNPARQGVLNAAAALLVLACSSSTEAPPDQTTSGTGGNTTTTQSGGQDKVTTTGTGAAGGSSMVGGSGGSGGTAPDPCADGEWTCLRMPPAGPYGTHEIKVPAAQNWVNTGLYLKTGQTAEISIQSGRWNVNNNKVGKTIDHGPCIVGDLVARIGLHYKDEKLNCVSDTLSLTADKDGILFLGALPSNDLGESYETRLKATGSKIVSVESSGDTVPTVLAREAAEYPFSDVSSKWVEIMGKHIIITIPTASAIEDAKVLEKALATLDQFYALQLELRGGLPHHGQRIRFFPDGQNPGLMLAGNPIRMQTKLVTEKDRISRAGQEGVGVWGYAHELGHDFTFVGANWAYQVKTLESWPNIFSVYAFQKMNLPLHNNTKNCDLKSEGNYEEGWDAWVGLCFLRQFELKYGWKFYQDFFAELSKYEQNSGIKNWNGVHDAFETIAGEDITPLFEAWKVPNPG